MDTVRWIAGAALLALGLIGTIGNLWLYFAYFILRRRFEASSVPFSSFFSLAGFFLLPLSMDMKSRMAVAAGLVVADIFTCISLPWLLWQAARGFPDDMDR